jgi:hypothetical protein
VAMLDGGPRLTPMGGVGELTRQVGDGIAGLVGGAVHAFFAGIASVVAAGQQALPGPWFFLVVGGLFVLLLVFVFRK